MARARNIKPSLFKNEVLGTIDPLLTILFEGLWCLADKEGRLEDRPLRIRAETLPYREGIDVNAMLTELERLEFIQRYKVGNLRLIQVLNFVKHQNPHHTEKKSELPAFSASCHVTVNSQLDTETAPADSLNTDFLIPDSRTQDAFVISPELSAYTQAVMEGIKTELDVTLLPDEPEWAEACEFAFRNNNSTDHAIEVFRLMRQQEWRSGPISAKSFCKNLPEIKRIRAEVEKQGRNGRPTDPGSIQPTVEIHCENCGDVGTITRFKKGSNSLKDADRVPCPDCSKEAIAA